MTHPLTPRETVEYWLDLALTTGANKQDFNMSEAVAGIMSAIASGSDDHSGGVTDMIDHAELAALREHRITADLLVSTLKADKAEAERKLAEAVGLLTELEQHVRAASDGRGHARAGIKSADAARTFLSKEAERG